MSLNGPQIPKHKSHTDCTVKNTGLVVAYSSTVCGNKADFGTSHLQKIDGHEAGLLTVHRAAKTHPRDVQHQVWDIRSSDLNLPPWSHGRMGGRATEESTDPILGQECREYIFIFPLTQPISCKPLKTGNNVDHTDPPQLHLHPSPMPRLLSTPSQTHEMKPGLHLQSQHTVGEKYTYTDHMLRGGKTGSKCL